jgi:hypothetical protein
MQLRTARLCLDCEEIHTEYRCPVCASEAFSYITRWVPAPERRSRPRTPSSADVQIYQRLTSRGDDEPARGGKFLKRAALGLTAAGLLGLFWGSHQARSAGGSRQRDPDDAA